MQFGPRFLNEHSRNLKEAIGDLLKAIGVKGDWPIRITRIDLAMDLPGEKMAILGVWS